MSAGTLFGTRGKSSKQDHLTGEWLERFSSGKRQAKSIDNQEERPKAQKIGHASRNWWQNTIALPKSSLLREIWSPVSFMFCWGTLIAFLYNKLYTANPLLAAKLTVPVHPHALVVSALGLLLVFRTNSAYERFVEGRKIWEDILSTSRDLSRMVLVFERPIGSAKKRRVLKLLASFPYLLRHRIQPDKLMRQVSDTLERNPQTTLLLYEDSALFDNDSDAAGVAHSEEETGHSRRSIRDLYCVDKKTLPWRLLPENALKGCAAAQNRALWVCDRMAQELATVPDQSDFTNRERMALMCMVDKLSRCIGQCERIHQTVVPLNYARHSLRSLTMWLLTVPLALVKDFGFVTGPVLAFMSWLLFGVYEIGCSIEDPFQGTLRLSILCDAIRRDVLGDEMHRETAFALKEEKEPDSEEVFLDTNWLAASRITPTALDLNLFDHQLVDFGNLNAAWLRNGTDLSTLR